MDTKSSSSSSAKKDNKNSDMQFEINSIILEYLEANTMRKTVDKFREECNVRGLPCPVKDQIAIEKIFQLKDAEEMLICFDNGNFDGFLKPWQIFQESIRTTNDDLKKLEVYLRVHFALWSKSKGESDSDNANAHNEAMINLKIFFERYSSDLSNQPSILPLFALPYVSDPKNHPIFRDLFEPTWSQRLRIQLESTIKKYFELLQEDVGLNSKLGILVSKSKLLEYIPDSFDSNQNSSSSSSDRFYQLLSSYRKLRKLLHGTRESYGKLLKVSNELVTGLENSVGGDKKELRPVILKCSTVFPELFVPNFIDSKNGSIENMDLEYFKKLTAGAVLDNIIDSEVSLFFVGLSDISPDSLNYPKIKNVLASNDSPVCEKLGLLQALRWLLTKSVPKCRQFALQAFIKNDLLGLNEQSRVYREKLFGSLITANPTYMKECLARLLNAFSSTKLGRNYLSKNSYCLNYLVKSLQSNMKGKNESFICQMIIATLQKLSLRKKMRLEMNEARVIEWLIGYIEADLEKKSPEQLEKIIGALKGSNSNTVGMWKAYNPYLQEYGWALLMNLCLHDESNISNTIAADILTCIVQMLYTKPGVEVSPYVVSTLYSLLKNPEYFALAKTLRLQNSLETIISNNDSEIINHLRHLITFLQTEEFDRIAAPGDVDYDDEDIADPEEFEPEIEIPEAWVSTLDGTCLIGDELLIQRYLPDKRNLKVVPSLSSPAAKKSSRSLREDNTGIIRRPVTPLKSSTKFQMPIKKIVGNKAKKPPKSLCTGGRVDIRFKNNIGDLIKLRDIDQNQSQSQSKLKNNTSSKSVQNPKKDISKGSLRNNFNSNTNVGKNVNVNPVMSMSMSKTCPACPGCPKYPVESKQIGVRYTQSGKIGKVNSMSMNSVDVMKELVKLGFEKPNWSKGNVKPRVNTGLYPSGKKSHGSLQMHIKNTASSTSKRY